MKKSFQYIFDIQKNHINNHTFKNYFPGISFTDSGLHRFSQCIGFLYGLIISNNPLADKYVNNFLNIFKNNKFINNKEKNKDEELKYITEIYDDGLMFSFSFSKYRIKNDNDIISSQTKVFNGTEYLFYINGGIIFHGLQEVFSTNVNDFIGWSIHT